MVFAGSRFATLTGMSSSLVGLGRRMAIRGKECNRLDYKSNDSAFIVSAYNWKYMRRALCVGFILLSALSAAQSSSRTDDFSITLERVGCLGFCPDYTVTILGNGSVRYEGRYYVRTKGIRQNTIPISDVKKLIQMLRDDNFLHWKEKPLVCLDFPEVHITAILDSRTKRVVEGCSTPGRVLRLADEIDRISGIQSWAENVRE
jgi:hypothetical protein